MPPDIISPYRCISLRMAGEDTSECNLMVVPVELYMLLFIFHPTAPTRFLSLYILLTSFQLTRVQQQTETAAEP